MTQLWNGIVELEMAPAWQLKNIRINFDDIWQKYSKDSRISVCNLETMKMTGSLVRERKAIKNNLDKN